MHREVRPLRVPVTLSFVVVGVSCAEVANAESLWLGTNVFNSTTGCTAGWNPVGSVFNSKFRPAGVGTNGSNSHFAVFDKAWATGFFLPNSSFNTTFRSVGATVIGSGSGTYSNAQVKFVSQAPATILNTSRFINISGQIKNFDFNVGCTVNSRRA